MVAAPEPRSPAALHPLLSSVFAASDQPIWVVDAAGRVVFATPEALEALGWTSLDEIVGRDSHELVHAHRPDGSPFPASECRMLRILQDGTAASGEDWFERADGSFIEVAWSSAAVALPGGRGVVHAFEDLTARRASGSANRPGGSADERRTELVAAQLRLMDHMRAAREQVVRDLHDGAQQRLVGLALQARMLREELEAADPAVVSLIDGVLQEAQLAIDELRDLATGLYPPILTSRGLVAAVRAQAARCPVATTVRSAADGVRLDPLIETNMYFLVAEALTNVAKHADAQTVEIAIELDADRFVLTIQDDGVGGVDADADSTGLGSMRDRARTLDGDLRIDSPRGGGTAITVRVPLDQPRR